MDITGIVTAKGNPKHIKDSLHSLTKLVREIIVVDIGIEAELLKDLTKLENLRIVTFSAVPYIELIREQSKQLAKNEYVFFLDPDEIIPETLVRTLINEYKKYDHISFPRKNIIFGKWISHSRWWPDYQTRLFKKNAVIWPTTIHKQPLLSGRGLKLGDKEEYALLHHNYESIDEYIEKATRYAKAEAQEKVKNGKEYGLSDSIVFALSEFISRFFSGKGYKDGIYGFILSFLQMLYSFLVFLYYWELKGKPQKIEDISSIPETFFKQGLYQTRYWMDKEGIRKKSIIQKIGEKLI